MPTISTFLQLLPKGFKSESYQSTESLIYTPVEGAGTVTIGDGGKTKTFDWTGQDVFVVPCWYPHHFETTEESVVFCFSDKVVQENWALAGASRKRLEYHLTVAASDKLSSRTIYCLTVN